MPLGTQPISPMLITIVIATYNAADTLTRCLHSIAPQKAEGVELLVVDGGSTDGTSEMAMKSPVVDKVASEPDRGVYDAWNKGVAMAGGEWVMFMGADDELLPGAIDTWMEMLRQLPASTTCEYICGYNEFADDSGKLLKVLGQPPAWRRMRKRMVAAHVASLHHRERLLEAYGPFDLRYGICADYELLLRRKQHLRYRFTDRRIARMHAGGMSMSSEAIRQTYLIRAHHHSVGRLHNRWLYWRDLLAFRLFNMRHGLKSQE